MKALFLLQSEEPLSPFSRIRSESNNSTLPPSFHSLYLDSSKRFFILNQLLFAHLVLDLMTTPSTMTNIWIWRNAGRRVIRSLFYLNVKHWYSRLICHCLLHILLHRRKGRVFSAVVPLLRQPIVPLPSMSSWVRFCSGMKYFASSKLSRVQRWIISSSLESDFTLLYLPYLSCAVHTMAIYLYKSSLHWRLNASINPLIKNLHIYLRYLFNLIYISSRWHNVARFVVIFSSAAPHDIW